MTLPVSGTLSLSDVLAELRVVNGGRAATISLGDSDVLNLAGKGGMPVSMSDLYGKSAYVPMSATLNDLPMGGAANSNTPYTAHASLTIALSGGLSPFTYAWSHVSGAGSVDAVNAATTTVNMPVARFGAVGDVATQIVQCVVQDATGATITRQCTVTMTLS